MVKYLLAFKRGGSYAARFRGPLGRIKVMALCNQIGGREKPIDCPDFKHKRTNLEVDLAAVDFTERRVISSLGVGRDFGNAAASTLKLRRSKRMQETIELTLKSLAVYAAPCQGDAMEGGSIGLACVAVAAAAAQCLNTRASAIGGGSSEIQHKVLARAALGL